MRGEAIWQARADAVLRSLGEQVEQRVVRLVSREMEQQGDI